MKKYLFQNLNSLNFIRLGVINLIFYFFPFITFSGEITSHVSGYQLLSWLDCPYDEGPTLALVAISMLVVSLAILVYGIYSYIKRDTISIEIDRKTSNMFITIFLVLNISAMIVDLFYINQMVNEYIFVGFATPIIGWGVIVLSVINITASILIIFFSRYRNTTN